MCKGRMEAFVAVLWIIPDRRIEKMLTQ